MPILLSEKLWLLSTKKALLRILKAAFCALIVQLAWGSCQQTRNCGKHKEGKIQTSNEISFFSYMEIIPEKRTILIAGLTAWQIKAHRKHFYNRPKKCREAVPSTTTGWALAVVTSLSMVLYPHMLLGTSVWKENNKYEMQQETKITKILFLLCSPSSYRSNDRIISQSNTSLSQQPQCQI